jgi:type VI secretion system secreted protein Hcp
MLRKEIIMAFDCFLKIEGLDGESTDDQHKKWIEVLSYSHGINQTASASASTAGGATAERCNHQDFSVVKALDAATPKLFEYCCTGQHIKEVTIELCRAGGDKVKYMEYKMSNVIISSVRPGGSSQGGETLPLEEVTFNYGKLELTYTQQKREDGSGGGNVSAGWDLQLNKKV